MAWTSGSTKTLGDCLPKHCHSPTQHPSLDLLRIMQNSMPYYFLVEYLATKKTTSNYYHVAQVKRYSTLTASHTCENNPSGCVGPLCCTSIAARIRAAAYTTFCCYWRELLPHVVVTKPRSDLCWVCQQNSTSIMRSMNKPPQGRSNRWGR